MPQNIKLTSTWWRFYVLTLGMQLVFLRSTMAQVIIPEVDVSRDEWRYPPERVKQSIQRVVSCTNFPDRNRQAFSIGRKFDDPIPDLAMLVANDSCSIEDWEAASHITSTQSSSARSQIIHLLNSENPKMVRGTLKLLLRSKVLKMDGSDTADPNSGPVCQELLPIFVARTFNTSPSNQKLAIKLLCKYTKQHRCVLLALASLLRQNDDIAKEAHRALELIDGDRYVRAISGRRLTSAGLPNLTAISIYIAILEYLAVPSELELIEKELGFLDISVGFLDTPLGEFPIERKMDEWISQRLDSLAIDALVKWISFRRPMNYDTFVKKMYEGNRLTLNQIAQLLNHQDSLVVEGAIDIFNILQRDQLIDSIDAGVWANRLGSVCKRHPALEHPACFAISMLGESDSTKRAFWKYASLPLLSDDGPTVFWAQLALTRVDPASAAQLGITRHAPIPFEEDEPVLTEHQRAKVKELIKTYGSLNP